MCMAVFMWQSHPKYPFLLLHNRDEFYSRPTEPLAWWEGETILGGKDGVSGGTWLGSTRNGRIAFLTNFRERETLPNPKTRGDLPLRFLQVRPRTPSVCHFVSYRGDKIHSSTYSNNPEPSQKEKEHEMH
ncbi:hypothetical protein VNO77_04585 [Canavalia gladiata]|uniref:Uncharacterized protein n=1 Tax=Canavalia gladiata TaxID=3824 RepID=A0AAN9MYT1_CANGL